MKKISLILILVLQFVLYFTVQAQEPVIKRSTVIEQYKGHPYYLHFVKQGETVTGIAKSYNVTQQELIAENPVLQDGLKTDQVLRIPERSEIVSKPEVTPNISPLAQPASDQVKAIEYIVKKKETLYSISKQFNLTVEELLQANPQMTSLQEGMELIIPKPGSMTKPVDKPAEKINKNSDASPVQGACREITVQQGQTVYSLSKQYSLTVEQFLNLNPEAAQGLKADQVVKVPSKPSENGVKPIPGGVTLKDETSKKKSIHSSGSLLPAWNTISPDSCRSRIHALKTYEIALLLPLALEDTDSILAQGEILTKSIEDYKAYDFFQFYSGILLAADSLGKSGFSAHIHVFDADMEDDTLKIKKTLRKNDLSKMDLIIGPIFVKSFDVAARFASREQVNIVNPFSKRDRIIEHNPFVYKVQVSDGDLAEGMAEYITEKNPGANIIAIRNGTKEMIPLYEAFIRQLKQQEKASNLKIKEVNYATESFQGVTGALVSDRKNILLMFSVNRSLVPNFVSLLNNYGKGKELTLFGMPGWENIEIETDFFMNLDYHQAMTSFVDYESEAVKQFIKQYRSFYGAEPLIDKHAFLGFDIGWYFFQALMNYGSEFGPCLRYLDINGLQYNFRFLNESAGNGYRNSSIKIVQLSDYKWVESR